MLCAPVPRPSTCSLLIQDQVASFPPGCKCCHVLASSCESPSFRSVVLCLGSSTCSWGSFCPRAVPSVGEETTPESGRLDGRVAHVCPVFQGTVSSVHLSVCGPPYRVQVGEELLVRHVLHHAPRFVLALCSLFWAPAHRAGWHSGWPPPTVMSSSFSVLLTAVARGGVGTPTWFTALDREEAVPPAPTDSQGPRVPDFSLWVQLCPGPGDDLIPEPGLHLVLFLHLPCHCSVFEVEGSL